MDTDLANHLAHSYRTPEQIADEFPTLSKTKLATWRHEGTGPRYRKAGKSVLYVLEEVVEWLEGTARHGTGPGQEG
ncbi:helix-turn-helix transcriptional regulator [Microbacterium rhizosphaerae]|uniref:DNA-binding protein n=1 Tax=Microbacterium rhizosphaerae TaxID=1678237 RepID=A0ABZ0SNC9_9MICO|nr:DNA-binding protein [Microbacterium rhizosphaerae]WPR89734.1 DNA-binding protein [Microbacterium rhizosphaerae]